MIDDILFQMVEGVDRHFNDPLNDATYQGALRERIIRLRDDAEYIVFVIDTPYPEWRLPEGFVRERIVKERLEAREQAEKETATSLKHRESWLQTPNKEHEDYNEAVVTLALQLSEKVRGEGFHSGYDLDVDPADVAYALWCDLTIDIIRKGTATEADLKEYVDTVDYNEPGGQILPVFPESYKLSRRLSGLRQADPISQSRWIGPECNGSATSLNPFLSRLQEAAE